jgi:hypothetical protein
MDIGAAVLRQNESLVIRDLAGEKVIVPIRGKVGDLGCIYTLNAVASEIWNRMDGTRSVADIVKELAGEYDVAFQALTHDVHRVVEELREEGLLLATSREPA